MTELGIATEAPRTKRIILNSKNMNAQPAKMDEPLIMNREQSEEYDKLKKDLKTARTLSVCTPLVLGSALTSIATILPKRGPIAGRNLAIGVMLTLAGTLLADKISSSVCEKKEDAFIEKIKTEGVQA